MVSDITARERRKMLNGTRAHMAQGRLCAGIECLLRAIGWCANSSGVSAPPSAAFYCHWSRAEPEWSLLGVEHLEQLPGLQWKLQNLEQLRKVNPKKFAAQSDALAQLLA